MNDQLVIVLFFNCWKKDSIFKTKVHNKQWITMHETEKPTAATDQS